MLEVNRASSEIWPKGPGPLGFDVRTPLASWQWFGTKINSFSSSRPLPTNYFAKSFTLSEAQLNETFNIGKDFFDQWLMFYLH